MKSPSERVLHTQGSMEDGFPSSTRSSLKKGGRLQTVQHNKNQQSVPNLKYAAPLAFANGLAQSGEKMRKNSNALAEKRRVSAFVSNKKGVPRTTNNTRPSSPTSPKKEPSSHQESAKKVHVPLGMLKKLGS